MIHILLGTRAQIIKMAPVMHLLQERGIDYNFIFLAQHRETILEILAEFGLKSPDYLLGDIGSDIVSAPRMAFWSLSVLYSGVVKRSEIFKGDKDGVVLVHGDAPPLLLGALLSRAQGLRVASVEAGLRSFKLFRPFPEELVRVLCGKLGLIDLHLCQDEAAMENAGRYPGRAVNTQGNTIIDAVRLAGQINSRKQLQSSDPLEVKYAVITLHRYETISRRAQMIRVVEMALHIAQTVQVTFILHPPTRTALKKFDLYDKLAQAPGIQLLPRQSFIEFQKLLSRAEFMVTDGGSNQEECSYLGIPTLIFRSETERQDGLGRNAVLSEFNDRTIDHFVKGYQQYRHPAAVTTASPSENIVDEVLEFAGQN